MKEFGMYYNVTVSRDSSELSVSVEPKREMDEWYQHEGLERVSAILSLLEDRLGYPDPDCETHASIWNPECQQLLKNAFDALGDLYQKIGEWGFDQEITKTDVNELEKQVRQILEKYVYQPNTEETRMKVQKELESVMCMEEQPEYEVHKPETKFMWLKVCNTTFIIDRNHVQKVFSALNQYSPLIDHCVVAFVEHHILKFREPLEEILLVGGLEKFYPKLDGVVYELNQASLEVVSEIAKAGGNALTFIQKFSESEDMQEVFDTFKKNQVQVKYQR